MAGRWDLGFPKTSAVSLREQLARATLNRVRSQGHPYVELREDGKRFIFFCTLCLAPCYSDAVLLDHLKGNLHTTRLSAAKLTLLKPNPWPFSDGIHFFDNSSVQEKQLGVMNGSQKKVLEFGNKRDNLAIVRYDENGKSGCIGNFRCDDDLNVNGETYALLIPGVLVKDGVSDLKVKFMGCGQIAARFLEKGEGSKEISRIWCEWLGENFRHDEDGSKVSDHNFGVVTFSYYYDLGKSGLIDDMKLLLPSSPHTELENDAEANRKKKRAFSDPDDTSQSPGNQYDSSGEESSVSSGASSKLLLDRYDDHLLNSRFISSKTVRREVRKQQRIASERMCGICQQKMLPEKDVSTLLNMKTGKLACSSRNLNGAFHVFHTSCLIHWVLLCESEMGKNHPVKPNVLRKSKRKNGVKRTRGGKDGALIVAKRQIDCVFCPECQGTGVDIEGDEIEMPTVPLPQMFKYKIKVSDGCRAWMKSPEILQNCSTGFHFPSQFEEVVKETVLPLKLLHFYKAYE